MNQLPRIPVIGIVGGIGSGKSAVARTAALQIPLTVIDCDRLGHEALDLPNIQQQLRDVFGNQIFLDNGRIDRSAVGRLVFGTDSHAQVRRNQLEQIVHPVIQEQVQKEIQHARGLKKSQAVLLDAAVLLESNWGHLADAVVFVDVPAEARFARVQSTRNWTFDEWSRREASQWPLDRKRAAAQLVISNAGEVEQAARQLVDWILLQQGRGDWPVPDLDPPQNQRPITFCHHDSIS